MMWLVLMNLLIKINKFLEVMIIVMVLSLSIEGILNMDRVHLYRCTRGFNYDTGARIVFWGELILNCEKNKSWDEAYNSSMIAYNELQYRRLQELKINEGSYFFKDVGKYKVRFYALTRYYYDRET